MASGRVGVESEIAPVVNCQVFIDPGIPGAPVCVRIEKGGHLPGIK